MNDDLLEMIQDNDVSDSQPDEQEIVEKKINFLIFTMNDEVFALESSFSREILNDLKVYPLPFVPSYVDGVLNRHGDPYTVVDPMVLFSKPKQSGSMFLVCKIPDEDFCIRITDILEFYEVKESEINSFSEVDGITYFKSSFLWNDKEVPVLNIFAFLDKIKRDLADE